MERIKGKMYVNKNGLVVICTETSTKNCFSGVVIQSKSNRDIIGHYHSNLISEYYPEHTGAITLNNCLFGK